MNLELKPYAYQGLPSPPPIYVGVRRGDAYATTDMTTVTAATATVYLPGASGPTTWAMTPVPAETTEDIVVLAYQPLTADLAKLGKITMVVTPYVGAAALVSTDPFTITVRAWIPGS